ncbi:MAG: hypothetical protein LBK77_08445 [Spirochaetaceae bacterium]|jgi:hypothetical protein|nr:hypothetical protein [Spirochaetaceae bacterium]
MDITEIQDELLRLEYPNLLPDHDPDIERYYYLRSMGQARDAMAIYQNRLKLRYPDDNFRTWLLRSYRSHDPVFRGLLAKGYRLLAVRSLERVKNIIIYIAERAESYNAKDVYSTIKTAEEILQFLPPERYEAVAGMERFLRYASVLDLKVPSIAKAVELVRAYLTDNLAVVEEERKRRSEALSRMEEAERQRLVQADWDSYYYQKKYGVHAPLIDLSVVVFSPADLNRIEIPPFPRVEDQILGYCVKYWNFVDDPAFERILFLYSRKYGKKNYEVFMAIRRGRQAKHRDDEILASIMSVLVTGYYYSIQGDIYLQRNWNTIKHILANQEPPKALPAPAAASPKAVAAPAGAGRRAAKAGTKRTGVKRTKDAAKKQAAVPQTTQGKAARGRPVREPVSRLVPKAKPKTAPRIAPPPVKPKGRPAAAVAKPAGRAAEHVPVKPVKVPYKLQPAREPKTTILARAVQKPAAPPPRPKPAVPVRAAQPAAPKPERFPARPLPVPAERAVPAPKPVPPSKPPKPALPPRPAGVIPPKPAQPPRPAAAIPPKSAQPPRPAGAIPPKSAQLPRPAGAIPPKPAQPPRPAVAIPPKPAQPPRPAAAIQSKPAQLPRPAAAIPPKPQPSKPAAAASSLPSKPLASAPPVQPGGYRPAPYVSASSPPSRPKPKVFTPKTLEKAKGSVSDRLKQLSGRSYDVYEDRFLSKARTVIRKVLGTGRGLFFNLPEEAEDLIYNFLRDHYSDPYMDWEDSAERRNLASMGFDLPSLNPVIDECYKLL